MNRYAEDYKPGETFDLGDYNVTLDEIVEFAKKYDPFPFHIDDQVAQSTIFGGIIASGWLTALIWLRLMHRNFISVETALGSPGHEEMKWLKPVRPGDRLNGRLEIKGIRISKSKPDLGFVRYTATLSNQSDDDVFLTTSTLIIKSRSSAEKDLRDHSVS
jgi:acyl dehydratase